MRRIKMCTQSKHFQVCYRALQMLAKPQVQALASMCFTALSTVVSHLNTLSVSHWHAPIQILSASLLPVLQELLCSHDGEHRPCSSSPSIDTMSAASSEQSLVTPPPHVESSIPIPDLHTGLSSPILSSPPVFFPQRPGAAVPARRPRAPHLGFSAEA